MDGKKVFGLILTVALAFFFIVPNGLGKLFGVMGIDAAAMADRFGYSTTFIMLIGALELLGGIGLLISRVRKWAAMGLLGLMVGALITHLRIGETTEVLMPIFTAVALLLVLKLNPGGGASESA